MIFHNVVITYAIPLNVAASVHIVQIKLMKRRTTQQQEYNRGNDTKPVQETKGANVTDLTLMTFASDPATVLPSLALLSHRVRVLPMDAASLVKMPENTILFLDARDDLATAKTLCRLIHASGLSTPIVLVLTEGGFTVVNSQWGIADVVVASASPAEVEGRLRLVSERGNSAGQCGFRFRRIGRAERRRHDPLRRPGGGHQRLYGKSAWASDRLGMQGVRTSQVPRAASGTRVHPRAAAAGSVGL